MKNRGEQPQRHIRGELRAHRKRSAGSDSNLEFVRAFADALRDILRDERARLHG
jgi:hypothetical protein